MNSLEILTRPIKGQQVFAAELPDYDVLRHCVRCGNCLTVCPTYQETQLETFSPRGRLALVKAVEDGVLDFTPKVEEHLYHCLDCRSCNTACPANIPIGEIILYARSAFSERRGRTWWRRLAFRHVLISGRRLGLAANFIRLYQEMRLDVLVRPVLGVLSGRLHDMEALLPRLPGLALEVREEKTAVSEPRRVGFFLGCMMGQLFVPESRATVDALTAAGCDVFTPPDIVCCGAPQDDQGDKDEARRMARTNVLAFERLEEEVGGLDAIVTDCAACSAMLKEYAELLRGDMAFAKRAGSFSAKVKDISEWYDEILPPELPLHTGGTPQTVTYHEPCHLANAQGVRKQPRDVMLRIEGLELVEMAESNYCCGSAGVYNVTHPEMAEKRLRRKLDNIAATGAPVVVTSNPGCLLQLRQGAKRAGLEIEVKHLSQLVNEALQSESQEHTEI